MVAAVTAWIRIAERHLQVSQHDVFHPEELVPVVAVVAQTESNNRRHVWKLSREHLRLPHELPNLRGLDLFGLRGDEERREPGELEAVLANGP